MIRCFVISGYPFDLYIITVTYDPGTKLGNPNIRMVHNVFYGEK